jgi:hypothetical protein
MRGILKKRGRRLRLPPNWFPQLAKRLGSWGALCGEGRVDLDHSTPVLNVPPQSEMLQKNRSAELRRVD